MWVAAKAPNDQMQNMHSAMQQQQQHKRPCSTKGPA